MFFSHEIMYFRHPERSEGIPSQSLNTKANAKNLHSPTLKDQYLLCN